MASKLRTRHHRIATLLVAFGLVAGVAIVPSLSQERRPTTRRSTSAKDKTRRDFNANCLSSGCHAQLKEHEQVHGPVSIGACQVCHAAAGAQEDHKFKPTRSPAEQCSFCHQPASKGESIHKVFADRDCLACHDPHGGSTRALLVTTDQSALCKKCHEPKAPGTTEASPQAATVEQTFENLHYQAGGKACLDCHRAHQSEFARLLHQREDTACFSCHDRSIARANLPNVRDVKSEVATAKHVHKPIVEGKCAGCHASHSVDSAHLLKSTYTSEFYMPFSDSAYRLCFECHDKSLATDDQRSATSFRDGARNLHAVHVNRDKGRTCAVCHDAHASALPGLIRQSVPFGPGGWQLPIGFEKTTTGGTCASGCHKKMSYDNSK